MAVCGKYRKERTHNTGASNRAASWAPHEGPIDFDANMRSTMPIKMRFKIDTQVPSLPTGTRNQDFSPKLPGHDYQQPRSDPRETARIRKETRAREAADAQATLDSTSPTLTRKGLSQDLTMSPTRSEKKKAPKPAPRWKAKSWYEAPHYVQAPLQRDEGETWNSMESHKIQGEIKGKDRLMRTVRRPEDVGTPDSEAKGRNHPLYFDKEEYYPGRSLIDAVSEEPDNDFPVRPAHLPDFYNPPPLDADSVSRVHRIREVVRQRYAGRPRLMNVFRACSMQKPGYVFPRDLKRVFDQMGIKVNDSECDILVKAVDRDRKGAITYEEFADLIYGPRLAVGDSPQEAQERHVRFITKKLVDNLLSNGQALGKAFCEIDPERHYAVSKDQFANAIATACNHISHQAVEFLWASQFPGQENESLDKKVIDWRDFMGQLAHFAHNNRAPTPCTVQGRKRQYDLLQRTAPLTGGRLEDLELNRPDQNADDEVQIVGGNLCHRATDLPHRPRDAAMLTEHYVEVLRAKAQRTERALPELIRKSRLQELLKDRDTVHQDDLIDMLVNELEEPNTQASLQRKEPIYAHSAKGADVMTLDQPIEGAAEAEVDAAPAPPAAPSAVAQGLAGPPASLKLLRGDIEAFVVTQRHNRDHEVDVQQFIENVYKPPDEKKVIHYVNDGLNRVLRGNPPPRERPPDSEKPRYENYWQARYVMEALADAIALVENSNGGKLKPSKMFKRLDFDNDGYLSLSDLRSACEKFKIPNSSADLHALFSLLDKDDRGAVDIGEFTRNYQVHQGSLLDSMMRPIKSVKHEGGVEFGGPIQEKMDAQMRELEERHQSQALRSSSAPPNSGDDGASEHGSRQNPITRAGSDVGSNRSQISRTGASIAGSAPIYDIQVNQLTGKARISDVIRSRFNAWKPDKSELYTSLPKTRFGMTIFPDTRHVAEPSVPLCSHSMGDAERFKTTNNMHSIFSVPDHQCPQVADTMQKHATREYKVERIRARQRDFWERSWAANEAAQQYDEMKVARKAMNLLNYERRCHMACA